MKKGTTSLSFIVRVFVFLVILIGLSPFLDGVTKIESFSSSQNEIINSSPNVSKLLPENVKNIKELENKKEHAVIFVTANWCGSCTSKIQALISNSKDFSNVKFYIADLEANRSFMNDIEVYLPEAFIFIDENNYRVVNGIRANLIPQKLNQLVTTGTVFLN